MPPGDGQDRSLAVAHPTPFPTLVTIYSNEGSCSGCTTEAQGARRRIRVCRPAPSEPLR